MCMSCLVCLLHRLAPLLGCQDAESTVLQLPAAEGWDRSIIHWHQTVCCSLKGANTKTLPDRPRYGNEGAVHELLGGGEVLMGGELESWQKPQAPRQLAGIQNSVEEIWEQLFSNFCGIGAVIGW